MSQNEALHRNLMTVPGTWICEWYFWTRFHKRHVTWCALSHYGNVHASGYHGSYVYINVTYAVWNRPLDNKSVILYLGDDFSCGLSGILEEETGRDRIWLGCEWLRGGRGTCRSPQQYETWSLICNNCLVELMSNIKVATLCSVIHMYILDIKVQFLGFADFSKLG